MELKSEFRVGIPVEQAWSTLTDVEFIAPCMPGAQLTEVDGDEFKGGVKIKVGPITAQYKGSAKFVELDEANRRIVLEATGRDSRGAGNAAAEVTAEMTPDGDGTVVSIATDLKVTGKVAQFGRGVMADVTEKLIGQFVDSLEQKLSEMGESDDADASVDGASSDGAETDAEAADAPASSGPRLPVQPSSQAQAPPRLRARCRDSSRALLVRCAPGAPQTSAQVEAVAALLGRLPQCAFDVVVAHDDGRPAVIANAPLLDDGRPMPTRYWLPNPPWTLSRSPRRTAVTPPNGTR